MCVGLGWLLGACVPAAQRPSPQRVSPATAVSVQQELPQSEGRHRLQSGQAVAQPPGPLPDQALPVYPSAWIERELAGIDVLARVSVDTAGRPVDLQVEIAPESSCMDECAGDFRASVERALRDWRFVPMQVTGWVDGPDADGDGSADTVTRAVVEQRPYSLRLRFHFELRDGVASVSTPPSSTGDGL